VTGFRQRGAKKKQKPVKPRRVKKRVARALKLPTAPPSIEVSWHDELGFFDAWDAELFGVWANVAKKALIRKGVPLVVVDDLWGSFPTEDVALVDGDLTPVIPYGDGETFIVDVEATFKEVEREQVKKLRRRRRKFKGSREGWVRSMEANIAAR